ncbi:MAG: hypothetical protein U5L05_06460 [Rubrivivax sp.]|nr:hypothetical protein [Rubrivivax sp.]
MLAPMLIEPWAPRAISAGCKRSPASSCLKPPVPVRLHALREQLREDLGGEPEAVFERFEADLRLLGLPAFGLPGFVGAASGGLWLWRSIRQGRHAGDDEP